MIEIIPLFILLFLIALELGGGLYETLVVHPGWKKSPDAKTLKESMELSGQMRSGKRFWPLVSPLTALLSVVNLILAWHSGIDARPLWLAAALIMVVDRLFTFIYFVPTLAKLQHPESMSSQKLVATIKAWTTLSSLRFVTGIVAWVLGAWVLYLK